MAIVLHYAPMTRAGRVRWLLEELGVPYELRRHALKSPELSSPEYRRLHPLGKVPALEVDGRGFFESGAMLVYLADRFADRGLAVAIDDPDRGTYLQWIFFATAHLEPPLVEMWAARDDPAGRARAAAKFDTGAGVVAGAIADGRPFLLGDQFTAADVAVGSALGWARGLGALDQHPTLIEYGRRIGGRPAARAARAD